MDIQEKKAQLEKFAKENFVPILRKSSGKFLSEQLEKYKPQRILEIGTAIGYSTLIIYSACPQAQIETVEIDKSRFDIAISTFQQLGIKNITCFNEDALKHLENLVKENAKFDFVFLDGPKGQYIKYLPYIEKILPSGGIMFADNLFLGGLIDNPHPEHKHRTMVNNMKKFTQEITSSKAFITTIYPIEDGIALCQKV